MTIKRGYIRILVAAMLVGLGFFGITRFDLSADSFTVSDNVAFTLQPGETRTFTVYITSPPDAVEGSYNIPITVLSSDGRSGSAVATYIVSDAVVNQPPVAEDDVVITDKNTPITIHVLANDHDPEDDLLTLILVGEPNKGTVIWNADDSITYTPGRKAKGTDVLDYTISDGNATATAMVSIAIAKGGGGGKGKGPNK